MISSKNFSLTQLFFLNQIGFSNQSDIGPQDPNNIYEVAIDAAKGFGKQQPPQQPHHYEVTSLNKTSHNTSPPESQHGISQLPHHYEVSNILQTNNDINMIKQNQPNLYEDVNYSTTLAAVGNKKQNLGNNTFDNGGYQAPDQEEPIYYETEPSPVQERRQINMYYDASKIGNHTKPIDDKTTDVHINEIYE